MLSCVPTQKIQVSCEDAETQTRGREVGKRDGPLVSENDVSVLVLYPGFCVPEATSTAGISSVSVRNG